MKNIETTAHEILCKVYSHSYDEALQAIITGLTNAYNLGNRHLLQPHTLGDGKIVKERDTFLNE